MTQETLRFMIMAIVFSFALVGASVLAGCSELKYAECIARDRTSNPCN